MEKHFDNKKLISEEGIEVKKSFGYLKPLGKILGNNFFFYHRPNTDDLFNTLRSFPKPVYWLTSANYLLSKSVNSLGIDSSHIYAFSTEKLNNDTHFQSIQLKELEETLYQIAQQNAMIVISCNKEDELNIGYKIESIITSLKEK